MSSLGRSAFGDCLLPKGSRKYIQELEMSCHQTYRLRRRDEIPVNQRLCDIRIGPYLLQRTKCGYNTTVAVVQLIEAARITATEVDGVSASLAATAKPAVPPPTTPSLFSIRLERLWLA